MMTEKEKDELKALLARFVLDVTERRDNPDLDATDHEVADDLLRAANDILADLSGWEG